MAQSSILYVARPFRSTRAPRPTGIDLWCQSRLSVTALATLARIQVTVQTIESKED